MNELLSGPNLCRAKTIWRSFPGKVLNWNRICLKVLDQSRTDSGSLRLTNHYFCPFELRSGSDPGCGSPGCIALFYLSGRSRSFRWLSYRQHPWRIWDSRHHFWQPGQPSFRIPGVANPVQDPGPASSRAIKCCHYWGSFASCPLFPSALNDNRGRDRSGNCLLWPWLPAAVVFRKTTLPV